MALWNRACDVCDVARGETRAGTLTMYDDYKRMRDKMTDYPWSSMKRLTGVCVLMGVALTWVFGFPLSVGGLLFGGPITRMVTLAYWVVFTLRPTRYLPRFHKWVSDLEIGEENGWKLIVRQPEAFRGADHPFLFISMPHCIYQAAVGFLFEFFRALGSIPCDTATILRTMRGGESVILTPGGSEEVMWAGRTDAEHIVLRNKKGFIKLALREGLHVVPLWTFGESMGTGVWDLPCFKLRHRLTQMVGIPFRFVSLCQRWFLPFPNGVLVVAVGAPLFLGKLECPTTEQLDAAHATFCEAVLKLVDDTKAEAGYPHIKVRLV